MSLVSLYVCVVVGVVLVEGVVVVIVAVVVVGVLGARFPNRCNEHALAVSQGCAYHLRARNISEGALALWSMHTQYNACMTVVEIL